jgi:hypothetical protein
MWSECLTTKKKPEFGLNDGSKRHIVDYQKSHVYGWMAGYLKTNVWLNVGTTCCNIEKYTLKKN